GGHFGFFNRKGNSMISGLLAKIGVPVLAQVVAGALRRTDNPLAQTAARALGDFDAAVRSGDVDVAEANRHAAELAKIHCEGDKALMAEINRTMRAETASDDVYVRRMRPTFGYVMAATWAAQMMAVA